MLAHGGCRGTSTYLGEWRTVAPGSLLGVSVHGGGAGHSSVACRVQAYKVAQRQFMPKDWITERWDQGFYITCVAGGPQLTMQAPACLSKQQSRSVVS